ncbi:MAG: response regulator [Desulfobacteraceae bacterium]
MEILIVEDENIFRLMLKNALEAMGHTIIEAEDGQQAWEILNAKKTKIVICDWVMPGLNGLELCKKIRSEAFKRYIYFIMLTAKNRKEDIVDVFRAGADDYIPKPFDLEEFKARVMNGIRVIDLEERYHSMAKTIIESRNKLRIVIDSLGEEIVSLDRDMKIVTVNKAFTNRLKCRPQEVVGKHCLDHAISENNFLRDEGLQSLVSHVFENGSEANELVVVKSGNGEETFLKVSCQPVRNELDDLFKVVVLAQDVSEDRRKTEQIHLLNEQLMANTAKIENQNTELKNTLKQLENTQAQMLHSEKMASIGQLAAGVAHEINNPTGFISSNLKTLVDYQSDIAHLIEKYRQLITDLGSVEFNDRIPEPLMQSAQKISAVENDIDLEFLLDDINDLIGDCREGTDRIKKIVMDLKDFAHPGEDKIKSIDINKGLESTLNVVNNEIKYKAKVKKDLGDIPPVKGYPQQLNQVFMNILVNAAQAIEKKGEIVVKTQQLNGHVEIKISDTGCGIPKENLRKIFDPFFTTKDVGKGTGLGMNIAYNIVKKHNGNIEADSTVGKGTTFTIKIPTDAFDRLEDC